MRIKFVYLLSILAFGIWSCKTDPKTASDEPKSAEGVTPSSVETNPKQAPVFTTKGEGIVFSGQITGFKDVPISLSKIGFTQKTPTILAQDKMDAEGRFVLNFAPQKKGVYAFKVGNQQILFLLDAGDSVVSINTNDKSFRAYDFEIKGAPINKKYLKLMNGAFNKSYSAEDIKKEVLLPKEPLVGTLAALQVLKDPGFLPIHRLLFNKLRKDKTVDKALYTDGYKSIIASMENFAKQQNAKKPIQVGMKAPELAYEDPTGKIRKLSDLKGKLVLLDFWASWCGPCRRANPKVVSIYKKYKDQGFTVFSVSLDGSKKDSSPAAKDRGRQKWKAAIKQDGLEWPNHVSDLKSWNSEASAKYGVTSIPATFLIGRDGKIVALEPGRGDLEGIIKKHL